MFVFMLLLERNLDYLLCCFVVFFVLFIAVVMLRLSLLSEQQQILRKWSANKWLSHKSVKFRVFAYSFISHAVDAFPFEGEKPLLQLDFCKPLKWSNTEHKPWLRFVLLMGWICAAPNHLPPFVLPSPSLGTCGTSLLCRWAGWTH